MKIELRRKNSEYYSHRTNNSTPTHLLYRVENKLRSCMDSTDVDLDFIDYDEYGDRIILTPVGKDYNTVVLYLTTVKMLEGYPNLPKGSCLVWYWIPDRHRILGQFKLPMFSLPTSWAGQGGCWVSAVVNTGFICDDDDQNSD